MFHAEEKSINPGTESFGFFQGVPPKTGFIFGIISGVATCALGLLILGFISLVR